MTRWKGATCLLSLWTWPWHALAVLQRGTPEEVPPVVGVRGGMADHLAGRLWAGVDLTEGEQDQLRDMAMQVKRGASGIDVAADSLGMGGDSDTQPEEVQLLGPLDSGTHLLQALVMLNWPSKAGKSSKSLSKLVFKHSIADAKDICERYLKGRLHENFTVLLALRNPVSQLVSWHKAPYILKNCTGRPLAEMGEPCFANLSPEWNGRSLNINAYKFYPGHSLQFKSAMDVYNRFAAQYKGMLSEPACSRIKVQLIRYEDMVFSPEEVLKEVARKAGWRMPSSLAVADAPAKEGGHPHGRFEAMEAIDSRSYLKQLSKTDLAARCDELDTSLVRDQFEKSFTGAPISYLKDCQAAG